MKFLKLHISRKFLIFSKRTIHINQRWILSSAYTYNVIYLFLKSPFPYISSNKYSPTINHIKNFNAKTSTSERDRNQPLQSDATIIQIKLFDSATSRYRRVWATSLSIGFGHLGPRWPPSTETLTLSGDFRHLNESHSRFPIVWREHRRFSVWKMSVKAQSERLKIYYGFWFLTDGIR